MVLSLQGGSHRMWVTSRYVWWWLLNQTSSHTYYRPLMVVDTIKDTNIIIYLNESLVVYS